MFELSLIKKNLEYGREVEGKEYAHKALSLDDVKWLILKVEEQEKELNEYKSRNIGLTNCDLMGLTEENGIPYGKHLHIKNAVIVDKKYLIKNHQEIVRAIHF